MASSGKPKSRVLVIGATGYIGRHVVMAGAKLGQPTFALARDPNPPDESKVALLQSFRDSGITILQGDLYDHESLVRAFRQVDVVISIVGLPQLADQVRLIAAIKEAGNIKRFLPSEFGSDVDRHHAVEPARSTLGIKVKIRRAVEAEGIPYTYVVSHFFAGYFLPNLCQTSSAAPPREKAVILGDGNVKAIFVDERDIGAYTIRAVDDPRTLNKTLYLRPPGNMYTLNGLISLWEKKIGKALEKTYLSEEEILQKIEAAESESAGLLGLLLSICHSVFVKGDQTNFEIEPSFGVEAAELYPDVEHTTVDQYLDKFV